MTSHDRHGFVPLSATDRRACARAVNVHALRDPRRPLPVDVRPLAAAAHGLNLAEMNHATRGELERVVSAIHQALIDYPHTLRPSQARRCPRVVAGKRCRAWSYPNVPCECQDWRLLDHARIWVGEARRHVLTAEPYRVDGDEMAAFVQMCGTLGLRVRLTGASPYFPGSTLLVVVEREDGPEGDNP